MKRSPAAAFWLSLLPGLGHLYLGQVPLGAALALLAAGIISVADNVDGFGIVIPVYWGGVMLDAHRAAQEFNRSIEKGESIVSGRAIGSPWWGALLMVMGVLFLLRNFNIDLFDYLARLWPMALIALGVKILTQNRLRVSTSFPSIPPAPAEPSAATGGADEHQNL